MNLHIQPKNGQWALRKDRAVMASSVHRLRRDAISKAKGMIAKKPGAIYVHAPDGSIVIRIPELSVEKVAATVLVKKAADMTPDGRKKIASWLRQHAADLVKFGTKYAENFRGRYYYNANRV